MITCPTYLAGERVEAPILDAAVTYDPDGERVAVLLINRSQHEVLDVSVAIADRKVAHVLEAEALGGVDVKAANTWEDRARVAPANCEAHVEQGEMLRVKIPAPGLAVVRVGLVVP